MNLANPQAIRHLFLQHHIRPQKNCGQNFLIDKTVLGQLIKSAKLKSTDTVLEVGAGLGTITQELVKHVSRVIAVELDNNLIPILRQNTRHAKNVMLISGDILKLNLKECGMLNAKYRIVANLPYNITSRFIRNMLTQSPKPKDMTLIIQREVADRICAKPGEDMSLLSVSVQFYAKPKILEYIRPENFWPKPEVESAIIKINNIKTPANVNEKKFFQIARLGFSARRKMLKNNLFAGLKLGESEIQKILASVGLNPRARPQDLSIQDWIRLSQELGQ